VSRTQQLTAVTKDSAGGTLTGRGITWASSATAVATVNANGLATAKVAGSATITATSEGKSGTAAITVINVPVATVSVSPSSAAITVGATQQVTATTKDSAGTTLTGRVVTWASSNTSVATVSSSGLVTGQAAGSATVSATSEGKSGTASITVQAAPPPPAGGVPDPTLLPVASGQVPNVVAYTALNVSSQPAGFSYNDPVTGVKIWKVTSRTVPMTNVGAGHDYADGGNEVSLGWGPNNNTHTILIRSQDGGGNGTYYLVDFTRGVGFSNYRLLTVQPARDLCFSFSHLASQPRIAYIYVKTGQVVRYNTATMQTENTGHFPLAVVAWAWLHQDRNDSWFTGLLADNKTVWVWNSQTNQYLTHFESWTNEGRLERDGRYVVLTSGGPYTTVRLWDLSNNSVGPTQDASNQFYLSHNASVRSRWGAENPNISAPFAQDRYEVSGGQIVRTQIFNNSGGGDHQAGNWVQSDAELGGDLNRQWLYITGEDDNPLFYDRLLWKMAIGLQRINGSDQRLLLHHYGAGPYRAYYDYPWGKPSPDGKVVIFNSNMNNSGGRWDLFVAEVPLR
jgi:Big-like domain-containing protein